MLIGIWEILMHHHAQRASWNQDSHANDLGRWAGTQLKKEVEHDAVSCDESSRAEAGETHEKRSKIAYARSHVVLSRREQASSQ
jgi:hypothetical protein